MPFLQRNQLVWLDPAAWSMVTARPWDHQAHALLTYWADQQLPLVVTRQREGASPNCVCLGLPAPLQWDRRRVALEASAEQIVRTGAFPWMQELVQQGSWHVAVHARAQALHGVGLQARVYGSHGWQSLTGLPCVQANSDLDLSFDAPDVNSAIAMCQRLATLEDGLRLDGEIVLHGGHAVAWRELYQLATGHVHQVLLRSRHHVQLIDLQGLRSL